MFNGILAWGKSKRYTDESLIGVGALKGAPAEVSDSEIDPTTGNTTITFSWEDTEGQTHTSEVEVQRGPKGEQGIQGIQGIQGNKGDAPIITEIANTVYNYQVKFDGSNSVTTPNLKGTAWFFGTQITSTDEAGVTSIIEHSKLYDLYLNTNTDNLYQRTDFNPVARREVANHWVKIGTLQGNSTNDKYCRSRFQLSGDPTEAMTRNDGSHTHSFTEDSIYKSSNTTVQPPAYVVDVWIRTA